MGFVIAIYTKEAFKEYVLPAINNADYSLVMNKNVFQLCEDIQLEFEVISDVWRIKRSKKYRLFLEQQEIRENIILENNQMFQIQSREKKQIFMIVRSCKNVFCSYKKYDIRRNKRITIGEGENNLIKCDYRRLISREHAEIQKKGKDYVITSKGQNGLYVNAKHVIDTEPLHFGDYINIYSLHMVFLGDILAIDTVNSNVRVNERYLTPHVEEKETPAPKEDDESISLPVKVMFHRSPRII